MRLGHLPSDPNEDSKFFFSFRTPNITATDMFAMRSDFPSRGSDVTKVGALSRIGGRQNHKATISIEPDDGWIWQKEGRGLWLPLDCRFACYGPQASCGPRLIGIICPVLIELCVSDWVRNTSLSLLTLLVCSVWGTLCGTSSRIYGWDGIICEVCSGAEETVHHRIYNTT